MGDFKSERISGREGWGGEQEQETTWKQKVPEM